MTMTAPTLSPVSPAPLSSPLQAQDPLAYLHDIHLPPEIGLWPPAWGWWALTLIICASIALAVFLFRRHQKRHGYRARALRELQQINAQYSSDKQADYLQAVAILLRRTAVSGFGSHFSVNLNGTAWLQWLDDQCTKENQSFTQGVGNILLTGPYQKQPLFDRAALHALCEQWIKKHRNPWQRKKFIANKEAAQDA